MLIPVFCNICTSKWKRKSLFESWSASKENESVRHTANKHLYCKRPSEIKCERAGLQDYWSIVYKSQYHQQSQSLFAKSTKALQNTDGNKTYLFLPCVSQADFLPIWARHSAHPALHSEKLTFVQYMLHDFSVNNIISIQIPHISPSPLPSHYTLAQMHNQTLLPVIHVGNMYRCISW